MKHLLLLHGALSSSMQFDKLAETLSGQYHIHRINFPGHGGLPLPDAPFSTELFVKEIQSYVAKHHLDSFGIFGYSMGGYVGVSYALSYPEKVTGIFTLASVFNWSPEKSAQEVMMLNPDVMEEKIPAFVHSLKLLHEPTDWKTLVLHTAGFMNTLGDRCLKESDFRKIAGPVRISVGDRDKMVDLNFSYQVSGWIPNGSFLVLPDTPHPFEKVQMSRLVFELKRFFE
jgi:pimeloyl-ACP methyl ester carboxylesterase